MFGASGGALTGVVKAASDPSSVRLAYLGTVELDAAAQFYPTPHSQQKIWASALQLQVQSRLRIALA